MRDRDSFDALTAIAAVLADMAAIWLGQMAAVWIRFDSGWIPLRFTREAGLYGRYAIAAAATIVIYLAVFQLLKLYTRPQSGSFAGRIPRLVRACLFGGAGALVCSGLLKNDDGYSFLSNAAILVSMATVTLLVLLERALMFRAEIWASRHVKPCHRTLVLGANEDAASFIRAIARDPRMRMEIVSIVPVAGETPAPGIPSDLIATMPWGTGNEEQGTGSRVQGTGNEEQGTRNEEHGTWNLDLPPDIDTLVLASHTMPHDDIVRLIVFCEQRLVRFSMIPDLFRMMTSRMEFQMIGRVPLVGVGHWPLDQVWNRVIKRVIDIIGGFVGMLISIPFVVVSAIAIKIESPGPVFYAQERCGRGGRVFRIYKLRTMRTDAESGDHPGWTEQDDPRRTRVGAFLRRWNIDELPQFWNVLKGDMSLVGPRPERPYFVERFTPGIEHYMWRHVSKPGLTGWAQVNGFRGDTSISERVKYDLHYLENWSLAFDFKILVRTLFTYRNAC
ncbi:MAG: sugar transferase [Kiritimatiellae bacterium]|nr:sugar transferase [Kiritimatiellia bacterium]